LKTRETREIERAGMKEQTCQQFKKKWKPIQISPDRKH
jgi:hypothetical protein